jgi:DNA-binding transcriptional LysR family regulator
MYDELIYFIKIVKLGSFADASRYTGISSSNLTRKIQKLEKELNLVLLKRDTRHLQLSSLGRQLYDKFYNLETEFNQTIINMESSRNEISGCINVLLPPCFALKIITPHLAGFLTQHPKISLNLTYENREINLIKDNFDLAIINHRPLKSSQKMRLLCRTKIIFYCYPEYIKKFGLPVKQEQIKDHPIIGIPLDNEVVDKKTYLISSGKFPAALLRSALK